MTLSPKSESALKALREALVGDGLALGALFVITHKDVPGFLIPDGSVEMKDGIISAIEQTAPHLRRQAFRGGAA